MALDLAHHFDAQGTDKKRKHRYHGYYDRLVRSLPEDAVLCEIGVFRGDSMAAFLGNRPGWRGVGVDIFERVSVRDVAARLGDLDVTLFACDSTDPAKSEEVAAQYVGQFDLVIDDGAHWPKANIATCENWLKTVKPGGRYLIEDVFPWFDLTPRERSIPWLAQQPDFYNDRDFRAFDAYLGDLASKGMDVSVHDFRRDSGQPDSVIVEIATPYA